jgi:tetratricopeptide (TPR) repeat protein
LASICDKQGRNEEAIRVFAAVVELSPHSHQGRQAGRRLGAFGADLARAGELPAAADAYRAALRSGQSGPAVYLNAALVSYQLGRRDAALQILQEGAGRFQKVADLQYRLGRLRAEQGATAEAEAAYARASEIDPARQDVHLALARLMEASKRVPQAMALYEQIAQTQPATKETQAATEALARLRARASR